MTREKIHVLLNEKKKFFFDSCDDNYLTNIIDQLGQNIYNIVLSAENSFIDLSQKEINFILGYRQCFNPNKVDLVPLHLYLLTIFNELENIALNDGNDKLKAVWSKIGNLIIETSLNLIEH